MIIFLIIRYLIEFCFKLMFFIGFKRLIGFLKEDNILKLLVLGGSVCDW